MKILCLNGNTTASITTRVGNEMRRVLKHSAEVIDGTPLIGPSVIKTRVDLSVATHGIVDAAARCSDVDGIMLAVSFDTGRDALREALGIPVVGMTEASIAMARMSGRNIGYVSIGKAITPLYKENLSHCHLQEDMIAWETIEAPAAYSQNSFTEADATLIAACDEVVKQGADVVVLLGAVLAGAAYRVQESVPVTVIDGGGAGALMLRSLVELGGPKTSVRTAGYHSSDGLTGVSEALKRMCS